MEKNVLTDNDTFPFGVHKGKKLANVPEEYLRWLYKKPWVKGKMMKYIEDHILQYDKPNKNENIDSNKNNQKAGLGSRPARSKRS